MFLIIKYYLSAENIKFTNKIRSSYTSELNLNRDDLPLLKNDTNNIIEFRDDIEVYKKNKKKYSFWGLLDK